MRHESERPRRNGQNAPASRPAREDAGRREGARRTRSRDDGTRGQRSSGTRGRREKPAAGQAKRKSVARSVEAANRRAQKAASKRASSRDAKAQHPREEQTAASGKRGSVKAEARDLVRRKGPVNSRNLKRVKSPGRAPRILVVVALVAIIAVAGAAALISQSDTAKYAACEQYRPVVSQACRECGLSTSWTDCLLAAMFVESGGDKYVKSVMGVSGDVMQAAEGAYGWVVKGGWPEHRVEAETTDASIYAGVMEFKQNLELWESYLGPITPNDATEIQLVIQGYNFGADGWLAWCRERDVHAYTVELAREYSDTKMPADAKGTPTHALKWLNAYDVIHSGH